MKILILLASLMMFNCAFAEDIKIVFTRGDAKVEKNDGEKLPLKKGMMIEETSTLITGSDGFVVFKINGVSTHRMEENTKIYIAELPYFFEDSKDLEQGGSFEIIQGVILNKIKKSKGIEPLRVKTRMVTFGVRGTTFLVSKDSDDNTLVSVKEGQVHAENQDDKTMDFIGKGESMETIENGTRFSKKQKFDFMKSIDWDVEKKEKVKRFRKIRKQVREELKKRRRKWVANNLSNKERIEKWQKRKAAYKEKIKDLKPSERRKERRKKFKAFRELRKKRIQTRNMFLNNPELKEKFQKMSPAEKKKALQNMKKRMQERKDSIQQRIKDNPEARERMKRRREFIKRRKKRLEQQQKP